MAITGPSMNEAINGSKDKPDDKEVEAIAPVVPEQRVVSDYKAAGRLPPLPGDGDSMGLPMSLPEDTNTPPSTVPLGLPPLPDGSGVGSGVVTDLVNPRNPLSVAAVNPEARVDYSSQTQGLNERANTEGLLRIGTHQELRNLDNRWNEARFRPVTYGEAVLARGSIPDPVAFDMAPVHQAARDQITSDIERQRSLTEDNFKHYWFNTLQPYSEKFFEYKSDFKPQPGFNADTWMRENNVDAQALGEVREGKYWEEVRNSKSSDEAQFWFQAARIRHKNLQHIQADGLGTQLALGMYADIVNPIHAPMMVVGPVAIGAMRSTRMIGRLTLAGTTTRSQVAGGIAEESISTGTYVAAQAAVGEIRTVYDALLEMGTGAVLSGVSSAAFSRSNKASAVNMQNEYVRRAYEDGINAVDVAEKKIEYARRAVDELGPNATPEMLAAKIGQYEFNDIDDVMRISLADLPDKDKLIKEFTAGTREAERIQMLESILKKRDDVRARNAARLKKQQEVSEFNQRADETDIANNEKYQRDLADYNERMMVQRSEEVAAAARDANSGVANDATEVADAATVGRTVDDGVDPMTSNELPDPGITATVDNNGNLDFTIPDTLRRPGVEVHTRGTKKFDLEFDNDLDRAAMMLNSSRKAKATVNTELRELITNHGLDPKAVSSYGRLIRDRLGDHIKKNNLKSGDNVRISDLVTDADRVRHFGPDVGKPTKKPVNGSSPRIDAGNIDSIRSGYRLDQELRGAKPRYKEFELVFDNDFDRVAYTLSNKAKSDREGSYINSLEQQGINPSIAREHGRYISAQIKKHVGNAQTGAPVNVSSLLNKSDVEGIIQGASARVETRAQAAAKRKLDKPPVEPKPAPRKQLDPDDLIMEKEISMPEIQDAIGLSSRFKTTSDIREALQLQMIDENIQSMPVRERSAEKNKLAKKLEKMYPGLMKALNPIATRMRATDNPIIKWMSEMLENPTGSTFGKTATMTKAMLEKQFKGAMERAYIISTSQYYRHKGVNPAFGHIDTRHSVEFNNKLFLFQINKSNGKPELNETMFDEVELRLFTDLGDELDRVGDMMRRAQITSKVAGWENLPDTSVGYLPWRVNPDKWMALDPDAKLSYARTMMDEVRKANPDFTDDEVFGISTSWVNVMTNKSSTDLFITTNPFSRRGASEVEQAIRNLSDITDAQKDMLLSKYKKGQLAHTKNRLKRDISATFMTDKDGNKVMLMDVMETDPIALMRSQIGRVSGEISVRQFGINGREDFARLRKIAATYSKSPKEMELFDQAQAMLLGLPTYNHTPAHEATDTFMSVLRAATLGKLVFAQVGEVFNAIPLIGVTGALRVLARTFSGASEAKNLSRGIKVNNPLLDDLDKLNGGIGTDNYRTVLPVGETGRSDLVPYSTTNLSLIARFARNAEHLQAKMTFFHGVLASHQRLITEEIVHKAAKMVRDGTNNKALMSMGVHPELAERIRKETDVFEYDSKGNLIRFNPLRAKDAQAMSEYVQAIRRGTGQIIQETFDGERGDWIGSSFWKLTLALRSFVLTSFQKQLVRSYTDFGAIKTVGYMIGSALLITPIQIAKVNLATIGMSSEEREEYLEKHLAPDKLAYTAASYGAVAGSGMDVMSILTAPFDLGYTNIRSGGGGRLSSLSASAGYAENLWNITGDVVVGRVNKDGERIRKPEKTFSVLPLGSVIGVAPIGRELLGLNDDDD